MKHKSTNTVNNMRCVNRQNIAKSREKTLRLPEDPPRRIAFEVICRPIDVRSDAENICKDLDEHLLKCFLLNHGKGAMEKFLFLLL